MSQDPVRIVIIGAGVGGLSAAIALKRQFNYENFVIYEKSGEIGGTWRDNTYPGCACDVPAHWYSLSTDPNPNWNQEYAEAQEIFAYWKSLVTKYKLKSHIRFNKLVDECRWDNDEQVYRIKLTDTTNGSHAQVEDKARVIFSAVGGFLDPQYAPELPGRDVFKGDIWHSSRWNHDINLSNKRVAVIGNGCSAVQFIPVISQDETTEIVNFVRSPHWLAPIPQFTIGPVMKGIFKYIPFAQLLYRYMIYYRSDFMYLIFPLHVHWLRNYLTGWLEYYIKRAAPKEYHDFLVPKYKLGCKRTIRDPGYLRALHRPNLKLNTNGIDHFTPGGLVTKTDEEFKFDILIFATGFEIMAHNINLIGTNGQTVKEFWEAEGGPTAYLGTTMPGFPNFFSLLGPNTATGHASVIFTEEAQINYALRMIKPIIQGRVKSFDVKSEASKTYNENIQSRLRKTVYTSCLSWYRGGAGHDEKIIATYPGFHAQFWWNTLVPRWEDYNASGVTNWKPVGKLLGLFRSLLFL